MTKPSAMSAYTAPSAMPWIASCRKSVTPSLPALERGKATPLERECAPVLVGGGRDLPEVAVRVAEVPEVPPLRLLGLLHDAAAGRLGLANDLVHRFLRRDDEVERDTTESGSLRRDAGVFGRRFPFVEGQRRRSVTQRELHELRIVLLDLAAQIGVELLGAG